MAFSLPRFLRRTAPAALKEYFAVRGIEFATPIDWQAGSTKLVPMLATAIGALPDNKCVTEEFELVEGLSDEIGQRELRRSIADDGLRARMDACDGSEARALLVLITDRGAFDRARGAAYAESRRYGRSWSGYLLPAQRLPSTDLADLARLEQDLKGLFRNFDGTGRRLKVEAFERTTEEEADGTERRIVHYTIYIEELPTTGTEFVRDEVRRVMRRPATEAAICHDLVAGTFEIVAKGGYKIRQRMAQAFAAHMLKSDAELTPIPPRRFDLDSLTWMTAFPVDPSDGIMKVSIASLRFGDIDASLGQVTIEATDPEHVDIHAVAARWSGDANPLLRPECRVLEAKLRIAFQPEKRGESPKYVTVELRWPNGSNLRDQTQRHQLIAEKYLARWGLIQEPVADAA
jgi:hypothetical protein